MSKQGTEQLMGIKYSVKSKGALGDDKVWKIHSIEDGKILQSYWADHIESDEVELWTGENTFGLEYTLFADGYVHYEKNPDTGKPVLVMTGYETENDLYPITWEQDKPIMVMFYGTNCKHCKDMEPEFDKLGEESPNIAFYKSDTEQDRVLAQRFEIKSLPTTILIKDGKEITRKEGALNKTGLFGVLDHIGE